MRHYFSFIGEWAAHGLAFPLLFVFAAFGPILVVVLCESRTQIIRILGNFLGFSAVVSYMFICIGTGVYLGRYHGLRGWGIPVGFIFFAVTGVLYTVLSRRASALLKRRA